MAEVEVQTQIKPKTINGFGSLEKESLSVENEWKAYQKFLFRVAFVFFGVIAIPTDAKWYKFFFTLDWTNLHCRDLYNLTNYAPNFIDIGSRSGWAGYATWGVILTGALVVATIWSLLDRKRKNYDVLYYWLRVIVRYRAALGIIGFGFLKIFPAQMPYPSYGILNGDFGDMTQQKVYWMSIAIVPWYQAFGGLLEITAGTLLFFRKTVAWGSALLIATLGAIVAVNVAYDNSLHVYASFFVVAGLFLMLHDFKKVNTLLIQEKFTQPFLFYSPSFTKGWLKYGRIAIKSSLITIFIVLAFYLEWVNFIYDPYKQPAVKGIAELRGNYNVTEFRLNNKTIPYSPLDSVRWSEVTFEKWTSMSYKVNKPQVVDLSNGGGSPARDINRTTEVAGLAGGRRVFHYQADVPNQVLYLQDKNIASIVKKKDLNQRAQAELVKDKIYPENWIPAIAKANIGDELYKINPKAMSTTRVREFQEPDYLNRKKMILNYQIQNNGARVILTGIDENKDSIYLVLGKVDRKYTLSKSTLDAGDYGLGKRDMNPVIGLW